MADFLLIIHDNALASWASAAGTLLASCVALYLGLRNKTKLVLLAQPGAPSLINSSLQNIDLIVENVGQRQVILRRISVEVELFKQRWKFSEQLLPHQKMEGLIPLQAAVLPIKISPGEANTVSIVVALSFQAHMLKMFDAQNRKLNVTNARVSLAVHIHAGKVYRIRLTSECEKIARETLGLKDFSTVDRTTG